MGHLAPDLLAGRRVLITGGGTGLGLGLAHRFASLGASLVLCGRRLPVLEAAATEIRARTASAEVAVHRCDVGDPAAVDGLMDAIWASGPLDVLVNNAAANFIAQTHALSHRATDAILRTSLHGPLYCTIAAGRRWIDAGRGGAVLSILSTSTLTGRAFTTASAMAKSGVLAMTRSLAVEWGPRNIRLTAIAPGSFPTEATRRQLGLDQRAGAIAGRVPLGRHGSVEELAELAAFMISDAGAFMTGEMVVLDGGAHLRSSGADDLLAWSDAQWAAHRDRTRKS